MQSTALQPRHISEGWLTFTGGVLLAVGLFAQLYETNTLLLVVDEPDVESADAALAWL